MTSKVIWSAIFTGLIEIIQHHKPISHCTCHRRSIGPLPSCSHCGNPIIQKCVPCFKCRGARKNIFARISATKLCQLLISRSNFDAKHLENIFFPSTLLQGTHITKYGQMFLQSLLQWYTISLTRQ